MRRLVCAVVVLAACTKPPATVPVAATPSTGLISSESFAAIEDDDTRAIAIFTELGKVLTHPRCVNCHPAGERPLQGEAGLPHQPHVVRGADGHGVPGLVCASCHGVESFENVPGNASWHLAPASMAWEGRSLGAICAQMKDPQRNGGLDLAGLVKHVAEDALVGYGWNPPSHLEPAPGDQATAGALMKAWVEAGAACPEG